MAPLIGLPEGSRRALWARLYARRRLLSDLAAPLAPMHYALIGEGLGYRPNAFFDPNHFRAHANIPKDPSRGLLETYLARAEPDAPSPSAEFDHSWYVSQNPDWAHGHPHPFLHFLERGLRAGKRPRADIDVEFVRDITRGVKPRSLEEAAFRVFDRSLSDGEMGPPLNRQDLRERQDRFYADGQLRIEREAARPNRNVLVFVQCGKDFDAAYLEEPRTYDVLLNYYREGTVNPKADIAVLQAGTKTTSIRRLLEFRPDLILRYQAVLFLDDDVEIDTSGIEALSRVMAAEKLDLAQPALTAEFGDGLSILETTLRRLRRHPSVFSRDHGAGADAPRPRMHEMGVRRIGQRLGQRPASGAGGPLGLRTVQRRGDRLGRRTARGAGGSQRRRLLRLSAPLWRRSRPRGEPGRRRLRRRAIFAAARAGRNGRILSGAARP